MKSYFIVLHMQFNFFWQTINDRENTAYIRTHKHSLAICLVNVVKHNDMLKINEPTHNHA